jgi:hypothetical protein
MKSHAIYTAAMTIALATCLAQHASALDKSPVLSLDLAKKIAAGCEAKAKEMGWKMNISVVDGGANEIFFERMDGAYLGSGDIARYKGRNVGAIPVPDTGHRAISLWQGSQGRHSPGIGAGTRHHCLCRRLADHDRR